MVRSQLNSYSGSDPIWGFVALVGTERFTGETAVGIDPRVRLFAVDGRVYFAEREGDAPIGALLVGTGLVTSTQLEHGAVKIGDASSLARLFQRDPTIDRDAVELTIALATESLLASIASKPVGMPEVFPLRHHSSGVHHWLRAETGSPAQAAPVFEEKTPVLEEATIADKKTVVAQQAPVAEAWNGSLTPWTVGAVIEESVPIEFVAEVAHDDTPHDDTPHDDASALESPAPAQGLFSLPTLDPVCALPATTAPWVEHDTHANGTNGHDPRTTIETVTEEQTPLPSMPTLPSLTTRVPWQKPAADDISVAPGAGTFDLLPEPVSYEPAPPPPVLPQPAAAPISMSDLAAANAEPKSPSSGATHNLAAVDIWEMVDDLTIDGQPEVQQLVSSGAPGKRGRGWLRGRKD